MKNIELIVFFQKGKYTHLADLVDDLKLMFDNAMLYNQEGSLIYNVS